ncbi:hypothetical protein IJ541_11675 [bacterium]|nr:hypothetical protein [bacterium]
MSGITGLNAYGYTPQYVNFGNNYKSNYSQNSYNNSPKNAEKKSMSTTTKLLLGLGAVATIVGGVLFHNSKLLKNSMKLSSELRILDDGVKVQKFDRNTVVEFIEDLIDKKIIKDVGEGSSVNIVRKAKNSEHLFEGHNDSNLLLALMRKNGNVDAVGYYDVEKFADAFESVLSKGNIYKINIA